MKHTHTKTTKSALPTLYIILTGGTVGAQKHSPHEATRYAPSENSLKLLVSSLTASYRNLETKYKIEIIQLEPIDSKDISLAYISNIYQTIFNLTKKNKIKLNDCIAIAHGTDNIEASITAMSLSAGLKELKQKNAIGFWGAMHTPDSENPDGPTNFKNLVKYFLSAHKKAGIFASFSGQIQNALFIRKKHARNIDTFKIPKDIFSKIKNNLLSSNTQFTHLHMPKQDEFAQIEIVHPYMQNSEIESIKQGIEKGEIHGLILENTADITNNQFSYNENIQELLKFAYKNNICITQTHTEYAYYAKHKTDHKQFLGIPILNSHGLSTEKVHIIMAMGLAGVNAEIIKSPKDLENIYIERTQNIVLPDMHIPKTRIDIKNTAKKQHNIKVIRNHINIYPQMLNVILDDINQGKIQGLIIEGPGNGTYNQSLQILIDSAGMQEKKIPVIVSSMCSGYINTVENEDAVGSGGINTEDCIKLLNEAINQGLDRKETHELFEKYKIY